MEGALRLMDVPPDDIETWIAAQQRSAASAPRAAVATAPLPPQPALVPAAAPASRPLPPALPAALDAGGAP
jgi:cell division protein FtsI (penicillin-binding protein 3)